jgi:hypothetical protein
MKKTTIGIITENVPSLPLKGGFREYYNFFVASNPARMTRVNMGGGQNGYVFNSLLCRNMRDFIPTSINVPEHPSPFRVSIANALKKILENEFHTFDIDVVTSYSELLNSSSSCKIAVLLTSQHSLVNNNSNISECGNPYLFLARQTAFDPMNPPPGFNAGYTIDPDAPIIESYFINPIDPGSVSAGFFAGEFPSLMNVNPGMQIVFVFSDLVAFGQPSFLDPDFHPRYCSYVNNVLPRDISSIASTAIHEIGHALGLEHHGLATAVTSEEYYDSPLSHWNPIMGAARSTIINQWNNGDYPNASNPSQDDAFIISHSADFKKLPQNHPILLYPDTWKNFYFFSTRLGLPDKTLITRNTRLISKDDIVTVEGVTTIEGLIGFPEDSDILKIILKSGSYEISDYPNMATRSASSEFITMQCFNIQILKSQNTEISKQTTDLNQPKRTPDHENSSNPTEFTCSAEYLPNPFPVNSKNACSAILIPEEVYESRPPLSDENAIVIPSPGTFNEARSILNLSISETCLVYIKISGDKIEGSQNFTSYGSLGKYNIIIKNNDTGSFDLNSILSEKAPPNCYATEKFTSFYPDQSLLYEDIFFTQDRSDFGSNEVYDGSSDHPHVKKFNVVINGTIKEIPILLQGKEYTDYSEIEDWTVKRLFSIRNEDGDLKIQEFVIAPTLDHS